MASTIAKPALVMGLIGSTTNQCKQSGDLSMTNRLTTADDASHSIDEKGRCEVLQTIADLSPSCKLFIV